MNKDQKQSLIEEGERILKHGYGTKKSDELIKIALTALTAQPVELPDRYDIGSMIDVEKDDDGPLYLREDVIGAIRAAGYEVQE